MKKFHGSKLIAWILGASLLGASLSTIAADAGSGDANEWKFGAEAYLWLPWIDVETQGGANVEISLDDILTNLDMLFMGAVSARKGKWTLVTDVIYFDIESNENEPLPLLLTLDDVNLEAAIVTLQARYNISETDKYRIDLLAGARYLWLEAELQVKTRPPLPPGSSKASDSGSVWDGIVGVTGQMDLSDKWYLQGYADIGTGESDYTWQASVSAGYRFKRVHAMVGYRHLDYKLDSSAAFADLTVTGPYVGVKFRF